jgi:hypothetical protein
VSQQPPWSPQADYVLSSRMGIRRAFKVSLYFVGVFLAALGILGVIATILEAVGNNSRSGYIVLFFEAIGLIVSLVFFFRKRYKAPCLRWPQYLWWILGATGGAIMALSLGIATISSRSILSSIILSFIILLYGMALAWIAHLKPSLRQQAGESIRRLLKAVPGKQMIVADLVTRLQSYYKCSDTALYQYIGDLKDIEQMAIPGTSISVCRMKGAKEELAFPQVHNITTYSLRQYVARALSFLNEDNVDIGLFMLSKEFEATLKDFLVAAYAKGKLPTTPGGKKPEKLSLPEMINCVKTNEIITDESALSYLREARNDRAHGAMPSLAERQLLMKYVQYLAGLYIAHIKYIDDLSQSV